jgi:hypothetical protein
MEFLLLLGVLGTIVMELITHIYISEKDRLSSTVVRLPFRAYDLHCLL